MLRFFQKRYNNRRETLFLHNNFCSFRLVIKSSGVKAPTQGALVYKLGRHPFTVEKAERYRYALQERGFTTFRLSYKKKSSVLLLGVSVSHDTL